MKIINLLFLSVIYLFAQDALTGIVKPIYEGKLSVSTDGIVSKILLKEGDFIRKGQIILKLDDKLQRLETLRRKTILDDKTQEKSLELNLVILKDILVKKEQLYKDTKAVSLNELSQLRMQYINSKGELANLKANEVKEDIEYQISAEVLEYYKLKSPTNGIITKIEPQEGEWVQVGKEIVHITNITTCFVEIDLEVSVLKDISVNSKVTVEVNNGVNIIKKEGRVNFISAVADSSSGLVRAKIYFNNKDNKVIPGLTATVIF